MEQGRFTVDLPIQNGDFSIEMLVYQRVTPLKPAIFTYQIQTWRWQMAGRGAQVLKVGTPAPSICGRKKPYLEMELSLGC